MTDLELTVAAAKAAGLPDTSGWTLDDFELYGFCPLTDDGDALRLAVKLQFLVNVTEFFSHATNGSVLEMVLHNGDPYAATRLAIVRAAAEIGRSMK